MDDRNGESNIFFKKIQFENALDSMDFNESGNLILFNVVHPLNEFFGMICISPMISRSEIFLNAFVPIVFNVDGNEI